MKHSVCVIDDSIPGFGETMLDHYSLSELLTREQWDDTNVQSLITQITNDENTWNLTAFKNPSFFFNHVEENILTPEIIIFDWDYGGKSEDSEDHLLNLLKSTYSIIYIYTGADNEGAVSEIINSLKFSDFSHRLGVIQKDDANSVRTLLKEVNTKHKNNFSFGFGKELKMNAVKAIDEILIEISKLSLPDFISLFGSRKGNKNTISTSELVDIITEKFRHQLLTQEFSKETETLTGSAGIDLTLAGKIWSYRLYHYPSDDIVRKGDIISKARSNDDTLYLVLSSDCHMNSFWKKNYGFISLIPIHKLSAANEKIKRRVIGLKEEALKKFNLSSLTNPQSVSGITILPSIKSKEGLYADYFLNPKEIFTKEIKFPKSDQKDIPLFYKDWKSFKGKDRMRISDPFLSPVIQFIMDNITGYGVPDFPEPLREQIKSTFHAARA